MHVIELNSTIGILLPSYSQKIMSGGLAACQSNPPPDGAVVHDGNAATSVRLNFFWKYLFIFFLETFQSDRGCSIAVVDDGSVATLVGLNFF
jgi:hypothetical protein